MKNKYVMVNDFGLSDVNIHPRRYSNEDKEKNMM